MSNSTEKKTPGIVILNILCWICGIVALLLLGVRLYFRVPVTNYYSDSVEAFVIPGIGDGLVAQGLSYDAKSDRYYVTGYMKNGSASPIYIVAEDAKKPDKKLLLTDENGAPFTGHAGGLTVHGDYIYVAGSEDACLYVYSYADAQSQSDGSSLACLGTFPMPEDFSVAFTTDDDEAIYAGEFFRAGTVYETPAEHKLTTAAGDYNQAILFAFRFSGADNAIFGLDPEPFVAYSLPDQAQGMVFHNGKVYVSTSWGVSPSFIHVYDLSKVHEGTYKLGGKSLPLKELDSSCLSYSRKIAPMSEELVFNSDRMYTMCESASNKYIFGKFTSGKYCYATTMQ